MELIIILLTFLSLLIFFYLLDNASLKTAYIKSLLSLSAIIVLITETLTSVHSIHYWGLLLSWLGVLGTITTLIYLKSSNLTQTLLSLFIHIKTKINDNFQTKKILAISVFVLISLVGLQGLLYPPNNWDSLTYHLSRVAHWASQSSVNHYPTSIFRQLYQPPFAEFGILHTAILNGNDFFSNSVQFVFWLSLVPIISLLVSLLSIHINFFILAALVLSLPEGILQASSTQNDLVVSFFILSAIYFTYKTFISKHPLQNALFVGLSIGLAMLTKGTAYFLLAPIILAFIIAVIKKMANKQSKFILYGFLVAMIAFALNAGHYTRNFKLMKNPLGTDSKMYANENIDAKTIVFSMAKNIGLHVGPHPINRLYDKALLKIQTLLNTPLNSPSTNFQNIPYSGAVSIPNHEDNAPNFIHFYLIVCSFLLGLFALFKRRESIKPSLVLLFILITQFVLFCAYLKWQPWHTRLHLPLFFLAMPLIFYFLYPFQIIKKHLPKLLMCLVWMGIGICCINYSRPLLTNSKTAAIKPLDERYKKYFANKIALHPEYVGIDSLVQTHQFNTLGIILIGDTWEYPLIYQNFSAKRNMIHLQIDNISATLAQDTIKPNCIISTKANDSLLFHQNIAYRNITPNHQFIWLFKAP